MTVTDLDLLRQFARDHSQDAFTTLVNRHVNLVFSAALRQVRSPHLAEEVCQSVFTDLARNASQLKADTILTAWLYQVARRTAVDVIRRESRRQLREQIATEINAMNAPAAEWSSIESLLDEAMQSLDDTDRAALLLRYFENKSLREVGVAIGVGDDAAQKRVSRAVDRLREFFSARNVTVGASGLTVLISANAVQSAPTSLVAAITATSLTAAVPISILVTTTKTLAMTTLQKTLFAVVIAAAVGTGIYQARQSAGLARQLQDLQQQLTPDQQRISTLERQLQDASNRVASLNEQIAQDRRNNLETLKLRAEVTKMQNDASQTNDPTQAAAKLWAARVAQLKGWFDANPSAKIPEFKLLSDDDWLSAVKSASLGSDKSFRRAASSLRAEAENKFAGLAHDALTKYMTDNNNQYPTDLSQLQSSFETSMDSDILDRWEITPASTIPNVGVGPTIITEKAPVDEMLDTRIALGREGYGSTDFLNTEVSSSLKPVYKAYSDANPGALPFGDYSKLLPYAQTPVEQAALQKMIARQAFNR